MSGRRRLGKDVLPVRVRARSRPLNKIRKKGDVGHFPGLKVAERIAEMYVVGVLLVTWSAAPLVSLPICHLASGIRSPLQSPDSHQTGTTGA